MGVCMSGWVRWEEGEIVLSFEWRVLNKQKNEELQI